MLVLLAGGRQRLGTSSKYGLVLGLGLGLRLGAREHLKTTALTIGGDLTPIYRGRGLTV